MEINGFKRDYYINLLIDTWYNRDRWFYEIRTFNIWKENLPRGWKPYYIYLIMVDHIEVGRIVLREGSNEERYYDGHIGYTIEKEYWGYHYSKDACLLLFDKAKEKDLNN